MSSYRLIRAHRGNECNVILWARDNTGRKMGFVVDDFSPYFYAPATETISNAIKRLIENGLIQAVKAEGKATKYMPIFTTPSEIEEDHFDNRKGTSSKFEDTKDIYKDISKENIAEDVSPSRETKRKKVIHSPEDQELYKATLESFRKAYKFPLTNLKKEGPAIYGIIEKARGLGDPVEVIPAILGEFRELKIHGDAFWKSQPFLPSVINAGGIWPRILEVVEKNKSSPREREENQEFIKNLFRRKA